MTKQKKPAKQNLNSFIKNLLRKGTFYWKARTEAMTAARVSRGRYKCANCLDEFGPKEVILDHIDPVVDPKVGFVDWNTYISRMYPPAEGFQVICTSCSDIKTRLENEMREFYKKQRKGENNES